MTLNLNVKQKKALKKIYDFVVQKNDKIFYLLGYAGTGKTFIISHIIKKLLLTNRMEHIYICAPTHKALNVIESFIKGNMTIVEQINYLTKMSFMTIHKLLEFKPIITAEDGSKVFKSSNESKFLKKMEDKLIVIDECSMISKEMVNSIQKYIEQYPIKIIFMGDSQQLPPVGEPESLIFQKIPENYQYYILLDEIMRTKSNDIKDVCSLIRSWNKEDSLAKLLMPIYHRNNKAFRFYKKNNNYLEMPWFKNFIKELTDGNIPIILTWRNNVADYYNTIIRKYMHKSKNINLNNYMVGDCAMFNNYYCSPKDGSNFYTSDMIKIIEIETEKSMLYDWKHLLILEPKTFLEKEFNTLVKKIGKKDNEFRIDIFTIERIHSDIIHIVQGQTHIIQTIHRDDMDKYQEMLENIKTHIEFFFKKYQDEQLTNKLWDTYYKKLLDPYAEINFGYSITVYKSQGSTFSTVFVDMDDLNYEYELDNFKKALYTAAGRAANKLGFLVS